MSFKINEDDPYVNKPKSISDLMGKFQIGREKTKYEHEYQEVASNIEKEFKKHGHGAEGKKIWPLLHQPIKGLTNHNLKKAGEIAVQRKVFKMAYIVGILKKL